MRILPGVLDFAKHILRKTITASQGPSIEIPLVIIERRIGGGIRIKRIFGTRETIPLVRIECSNGRITANEIGFFAGFREVSHDFSGIPSDRPVVETSAAIIYVQVTIIGPDTP